MDRFHQVNPFAKHDSHSSNAVITYKILTIVTWLLAVITSVYYSTHGPDEGHYWRLSIWQWNYRYPSGFTLNEYIVEIYFIVLFILQLGYIAHLFSGDVARVNAAASVGSHFILNNLLQFAFVLLFVRGHFGWAEVILILNFFNLSSQYFRHNSYPRFIHEPAVSGPLAWTFVAIYWNGALAVYHPHNLVARIFANIFVWAILVYGAFFIVAYKDYTMGFNLSVLAAALGVAQFHRQIIAFQWIFAFTIMAVLFVSTVVVAVPAWTGRARTDEAPPADAERAPLLADSA